MNRAIRALAALSSLAASAGCSTPSTPADPVTCSAGFLGDASSPVDFDILAVNAGYHTVQLADGGTISLLRPTQGGRVLFVGVRVTNVDPCGLMLTGALRDEKTQQVTFDSRPINLIPTGDGSGETGTIGADVSGIIANFSNIPACANSWSPTNVDGNTYGLEVTVTDRGGRTLKKVMQVTPVCDTPGTEHADCVCLCRASSAQDVPCSEDAGDDGGDD